MKIKLNNLEFDPGILLKEGFTQSLINEFCYCRKSFLIRMNKLVKKDTENYTGFGSMFHNFLENYFLFIKNKKDLPKEKNINFLCEEGLKKSLLSIKTEEETNRDFLILKELAWQYVIRCAKEDLKKDNLFPEMVFDTSFCNYRIRGKVDLYFNDSSIMEHKVKSRINEENINDYLMIDFQTLFYAYFTQSKTVIYDIIRKPQFRKEFKSEKELIKYIRSAIEKEPEHYFKRIRNVITGEQKEDFKEELNKKILDIFTCIRVNRFYRNENACYNAAYTCRHLRACSSGLIGNDYKYEDKFYPELEKEV